jgi:hypothetical protein
MAVLAHTKTHDIEELTVVGHGQEVERPLELRLLPPSFSPRGNGKLGTAGEAVSVAGIVAGSRAEGVERIPGMRVEIAEV